MTNKKNFYKIIFWVYVAILFVMSSLPNLPVEKTITLGSKLRLDYIAHFFEYAIAWILIYKAYGNVFLMTLLLVTFAMLEELHQYFIPGRTVNIKDFMFDILGLVFSFVVWFSYRGILDIRQKIINIEDIKKL